MDKEMDTKTNRRMRGRMMVRCIMDEEGKMGRWIDGYVHTARWIDEWTCRRIRG